VEENMVYCPECETDLDIDEDEVDEGAVVSCPECGADFEVITVKTRSKKMKTTRKPTKKKMRTKIPEEFCAFLPVQD
jgi:DNA-directed RNA polymerase subunit M/transcription elongation factor TFIIS